MAISIAILNCRDKLSIHFGGWDSKEDAQKWLDSGSDEVVIALEKYQGVEHGPNTEILEAIMLSAGNEFALGRDLEDLVNFCFELGRKVER